MKETNLPIFPFTAIVGQEEMKLALELNVVDPKIGGVMIMGDRGTGKSTTIRAIADLLPKIDIVKDDPFNSDPKDLELMSSEVLARYRNGEEMETEPIKIPMIDLPLGATEDRVCGTIDIEKALTEGVKAFEPGLLAKANRGILYVDEVNLLDDHLVDILLDSAASGWNTVEREGISIKHPARFVLVGSGNPEEGELRPQLLDRFGFSVEVKSPEDIDERIEVVKRRDEYEVNPKKFLRIWLPEEKKLRDKILLARKLVKTVTISDQILKKCATLCVEIGADGLRGELTLLRTARAYAAFNGRKEVEENHLQEICLPALRHRLRKNPLDEAGSDVRISRAVAGILNS